eukprot:127341_1
MQCPLLFGKYLIFHHYHPPNATFCAMVMLEKKYEQFIPNGIINMIINYYFTTQDYTMHQIKSAKKDKDEFISPVFIIQSFKWYLRFCPKVTITQGSRVTKYKAAVLYICC